MRKILAIIGSGHLGQQIAHYAISDNHFDEVVFFDDYNKDGIVNGYKILGTTNDILIEYESTIEPELDGSAKRAALFSYVASEYAPFNRENQQVINYK